MSAGIAAAQSDNQAAKDSLRKAIIVQEGEEKLKTLQRLGLIYYNEVRDKQSVDSLITVYDELSREAKKQGNLKAEGVIRVNIFGAMAHVQMFDEIIARAPEYLNFLKENELWEYYFMLGGQLLNAYTEIGKQEKALAEAQRFYAEAQELQNKQGMASILHSIAVIYNSQRRFEEGVEHLRKVTELFQGEDKLLPLLATVYNNLCSALLLLNRYDELLTCLVEFEDINKRCEAHMKVPVPVAWGNLWTIYANLYIETGEHDKAEIYCNKIDSATESPAFKRLTYKQRTSILIARKQYTEALAMNDKAMELATNPTSINATRALRMEALEKMGRGEEAFELFKIAVESNDSIRNVQFNAQLDALRTQYEVDRHIFEKERNRSYFLFALAGCILLAIALGIWIYYSRKIARKNRALALQIRAMTEQQELREAELLNKTSFVNEEYLSQIRESNDEFCPESRKDKLCIAIRDLILRDKAYRNPGITRDYVIERLGTNRELFVEAFMYCFGMSFPEYINTLRLKDAVTLLQQSDLTIEEISEKTGFGTVRTFQRQFQTRYGMSAKDYRISAKTS